MSCCGPGAAPRWVLFFLNFVLLLQLLPAVRWVQVTREVEIVGVATGQRGDLRC